MGIAPGTGAGDGSRSSSKVLLTSNGEKPPRSLGGFFSPANPYSHLGLFSPSHSC